MRSPLREVSFCRTSVPELNSDVAVPKDSSSSAHDAAQVSLQQKHSLMLCFVLLLGCKCSCPWFPPDLQFTSLTC